MNVSIIIPCFNESENIPTLREELLPVVLGLVHAEPDVPAHASSVEVIFVDDGSRDGTLSCLREAFGNQDRNGICFRFEQHKINRGLGAALRTGFAASQGDFVVTTDSDGTYPYKGIPKLLSYLTSGMDIVTASPYHPAGRVIGVPAYRLILSRGSSFLYRILVNRNVHTYTSLFRAYRRIVIDEISIDSDGFLAGTELLVKGMLKGFQVAEYPAALYRRIYGTSKAKLLSTILAHLQFQGWILLYRFGLVRL